MKIETRINRILNADIPDHLKAAKLDTLALKLIGGSPAQKLAKDAAEAVKAKLGGHKAAYAAFFANVRDDHV